jgi:hypothetical protein
VPVMRARHYVRWYNGDCTPPVATALCVAQHATRTLCSVSTSTKKSAIPPLPSSSLMPLLCSALHCHPPLCLSWPTTTELLPSPSKLGERLTVVTSASCTELELEPSVIDAGRESSPCCLLLLCGSPSTTVLQPPPNQPTIPWAPSLSPAAHRPEVPLWQPLIYATDDRLTTAIFLTISRPPRWSPLCQTGTNRVLGC